jgi:hypothetical protein
MRAFLRLYMPEGCIMVGAVLFGLLLLFLAGAQL